MRKIHLYTSSNIAGSIRYWVEVVEQPLYWAIVGWLYHKYEDTLWRLPGYRQFENWLIHLHRNDEWYIPPSNERDCTCDWLTQRKHVTRILEVEVTEEQYEVLK